MKAGSGVEASIGKEMWTRRMWVSKNAKLAWMKARGVFCHSDGAAQEAGTHANWPRLATVWAYLPERLPVKMPRQDQSKTALSRSSHREQSLSRAEIINF